MSDIKLSSLSDDDLLSRVRRVYIRSRKLTADLVRILVEIEERRLHLRSAYSSLFEFCVRHLGMSKSSAHRYVTAARLSVKFPQLLGRIESGEVHLSTLIKMRDHLTVANVDDLLDRARGRSRFEVEELIATIAPRPDEPARMRKLPTSRTGDTVDPAKRDIEPIAEARYRVAFTADRELYDDIKEVRDRMRHSNPNGDLGHLFKYCVNAGLQNLRSRRHGSPRVRPERKDGANRPRPKKYPPIPATVRRAVYARDGERCTFHCPKGRRCECTTFLELDHIMPRADGGPDTAENLRVRCRAHNRLHAEDIFGKAFVDKCIRAYQLERAAARAADEHSSSNGHKTKKPRGSTGEPAALQ